MTDLQWFIHLFWDDLFQMGGYNIFTQNSGGARAGRNNAAPSDWSAGRCHCCYGKSLLSFIIWLDVKRCVQLVVSPTVSATNSVLDRASGWHYWAVYRWADRQLRLGCGVVRYVDYQTVGPLSSTDPQRGTELGIKCRGSIWNKKLSCRRKTARCFVSLHISRSHSRSLEIAPFDRSHTSSIGVLY